MKKRILSILTLLAMLIACLSFVGCGSSLELTAPQNVKYDGSVITWDAVSGANKYYVKIDNGNELSVSTPSYGFSSSAETFTVTVSAANAEEEVRSTETTMTFIALARIESISVENGVASWAEVENATAYEIKIAGQNGITTVTDAFFAPSEAGEYSIQVRPTVSGNASYWSKWSATKTFTILGQVSPDDVTYSNGKIKWKGLIGATGYEVYVNGTALSLDCTTTEIAYDAENTSFEVAIKALGDGVVSFTGAISEAKNFIFLDTVTNLNVVDGIVTWDAVVGATGYQIKLNGNVKSEVLTECKFQGLQVGRETSISVLPISDDSTYFSEWSVEKSVFILRAPELKWNNDLELDGQANSNIYWDPVEGAQGYTVKVISPSGTEEVHTYSETQAFYQDTYLESGEYIISVKTNANAASGTYDSTYSTSLSVTRLESPTPATENYIVSNKDDVTEGFTVTFNHVYGANGYKLYKDGNELLSSTNAQFQVGSVIGANVTEEQHFNFKIRAMGSVSSDGKTIKLPSLTSNALSFEITVLAMPTNVDIQEYTLSFQGPSNNNGYSVVGVSDTALVVEQASCDLSHISEGGKSVKVSTRGNGSNVLPSNFTPAINVFRLSAPYNVQIESENSGGTLIFDGPNDYATSYTITFDSDNAQVPVDTINNIRERITTQGTTIHMYSVANYFNQDRTIYYMSSNRSLAYQFIKLDKPSFGDKAFTNEYLEWNASSNINTAEYTPTYEVYKADNTKYNGEANGTRYSLEELAGGSDYQFKIKAIGNGTKYIDSDFSATVSIYKLATPEVNRVAGGKYAFRAVASANSYTVYIGEDLKATFQHESGKMYEFKPDFEDLTSYEIRVYAVGDGGYETIDSIPNKFIQETKQLTTPEISVSYTKEQFDVQGEIKVTVTTASEYATGYHYSVGSVTGNGNEEYLYQPNAAGEYTVRAYALGGDWDADGKYCLNSQTTSAKKITLLTSPNPDNVVYNEDGYISWSPVNGTSRYQISVSIDGGEFTTPDTVSSSNRYNIDAFEATSIIVRLTALGNNGNVISSATIEKELLG